MPKKLKNAKIGLVNAALEIKKKPKLTHASKSKTQPQLQAFLDEEETMLKKMGSRKSNEAEQTSSSAERNR